MKKVHFRLFGWALGVVVMLAVAFRVATVPSLTVVKNQSNKTALANATDNNSAVARAKQSFSKLPMAFEQNKGQTDPQVKYIARGPGYSVFLTGDESVLKLKSSKEEATVRTHLAGANRNPKIQAEAQLPGKSNYLRGKDPSKWITNVSTFAKVRYQDVYPGIDVVYQGDQGRLRYDFVVKPGASPSSIQVTFDGPNKLATDKDGNLVLSIAGKELRHLKPYTYQEMGGVRKEVASNFAIHNGQVAFEVARYDASQPLIIDPSVIFSTLFGGNLTDQVNGVAINTTGLPANSVPGVFLVGTTNSPVFTTASSLSTGLGAGYQGSKLSGLQDAFVAKMTLPGNTLVYSTYLGGGAGDFGNAIAVDNNGFATVVGQTYSADFPITTGTNPIATIGTNTNAAFIAKLTAAGSGFVFSRVLDGPANDFGTGVALDRTANQNPCMVGYTDSTTFPTNSTIAGQTNNGSADSFVACFAYSTGAITGQQLFGGAGSDLAHGIAIDGAGNIWIGGDTNSLSFLVNGNTITGLTATTQPTCSAGWMAASTLTTGTQVPCTNGFVASFPSATGANIVGPASYASYFSGTDSGSGTTHGFETITGVAADAVGRVYITGATTSTFIPGTIAPSTSGAITGSFQTQSANTIGQAFAAIIDPSVGGVVWSTFYGSTTGITKANGISIDNSPVSRSPIATGVAGAQYAQVYLTGFTFCATASSSGTCQNALPQANGVIPSGFNSAPAFANPIMNLGSGTTGGVGPFTQAPDYKAISIAAGLTIGEQDGFLRPFQPQRHLGVPVHTRIQRFLVYVGQQCGWVGYHG